MTEEDGAHHTLRIVVATLVSATVAAGSARAQVTKVAVPGVLNFAKVETTIALEHGG